MNRKAHLFLLLSAQSFSLSVASGIISASDFSSWILLVIILALDNYFWFSVGDSETIWLLFCNFDDVSLFDWDNLNMSINLTCTFLRCGMKPEHSEKTYTDMGRTGKLQTVNPDGDNFFFPCQCYTKMLFKDLLYMYTYIYVICCKMLTYEILKTG